MSSESNKEKPRRRVGSSPFRLTHIFNKRRTAKLKRTWLRLILPFIVGAAATFTFVFTVFLPTYKKEIVPAISPESVIKVNVSLITDTRTVYWLSNNQVDKKIAIQSLPMYLKISNISEHPLVIEDILVRFKDRYQDIGGLTGITPPLNTWKAEREYTGAAEASYNVYALKVPHPPVAARSVITDAEPIPEEVSKHKKVYYRIPANDTDLIGIEFNAEEQYPSDESNYEALYDITFEIKGITQGREFSYTYSCPYSLILITKNQFAKLYPDAD